MMTRLKLLFRTREGSTVDKPKRKPPNKEARNAYLAVWREANRDKTRAAQRKYYAANKEACLAKVKACHAANRAHYTAKTLEWSRANPDRVAANRKRSYENLRARNIARARGRVVKYLLAEQGMSKAEQAIVEGIYLFCAVFKQFEVDHRVPLTHKLVCGLHNSANLQPLLISENRSKGNKFNPEDWPHEDDYLVAIVPYDLDPVSP